MASVPIESNEVEICEGSKVVEVVLNLEESEIAIILLQCGEKSQGTKRCEWVGDACTSRSQRRAI
jgi:hypothetical protein